MANAKVYKVEVTQEDIDNGKPEEIHLCPIALACKRAGLEGVGVDADEIWHDWKGDYGTYKMFHKTTDRARRFVLDFDNGGADLVTPFEFEVNPDDGYTLDF